MDIHGRNSGVFQRWRTRGPRPHRHACARARARTHTHTPQDKLNDLKSKGLPHAEGIGLIDDFLAVKHGHDLGVKLTKLVAMRESLNAWVIAAPHGPERQSVRFADVQVGQ